MRSLSTFVALFALTAAPTALAAGAGSSCVAFDTAWNLLAFGFNGKDYNAGTSDQWASGSATDITTTGRPPFDGKATTCYLAEFFNAIYVIGADSANPSSVYIYDATKKSWSTQATTLGGFDPTSYTAILDHDTNVFYALSKNELYSLDMAELVAGTSSAIPWQDQGSAQIQTTNYDPVMAIAQNHVFLFGVPGNPAGATSIFVIHFAFWQPGSQPFSGDAFPDSHGQATSFFLDQGVQQQIAFVPDDGSKTYVLNVETNTTQTLAGPSTVDASASYFASTTALVQLTSGGAVNWLPFNPSDTGANSAAKWSSVANLAAVAPPSGGSGTSATNSASGSNTAKSTGSKTSGGGPVTGSSTGSAANPSNTSSAIRSVAWSSGSVLALIAAALSLL